MKKYLLLLINLLLAFKFGYTQWNYFTYLNTYISAGVYGVFNDVNFISESSGMYNYSHYWSPSSGTSIWLKSTNDSGNSWGSVYSVTQMGLGVYAIHTVNNQNTFFHIWNWQGSTRINKYTIGLPSRSIDIGGCGFYKDFSIIDTSHFYLLYYDNACTFPGKYYINKYINGIITKKIDSFYIVYPNVMIFPDTNTGYISGATPQNSKNHLIIKSILSGTSWFTIFDDSLFNIRKMFFTSANYGYIVGDSGRIIKTTNGGFNWQYLNTNTKLNLYSVFFINDSTGYAAGDSGLIIKTIDGGNIWEKQATGTLNIFTKIFFVNDSIGFALTGNSLFKTNQNYSPGTWERYSLVNKDLLIYPNPSKNGKFNIKSGIIISNIEIINAFGEDIFSAQANSDRIEIDLRKRAKGLYYIRLTQADKTCITSKIVIADK